MRKLFFLSTLILVVAAQGCDIEMHDTIKGNGNTTTATRNISDVSKIKSKGSFDIEVVLGSAPALKIEADENLMPYILTDNENGGLNIHTKDDVDLSSNHTLKITVTVSKLEELELYGNGNGICNSKLTGGDHLKLGVYGNGDITMNVNAPRVESTIAGNGNITVNGETKDSKIEIDGNGDYKAEGLQAENAEIHINGSGSANVAASVKLDIHIAGSGDVYYKGSPAIEQHIVGSGNIKQVN